MKNLIKLLKSLLSFVLVLSLILGCTFMASATSTPAELGDLSSLYQTYLNPSEELIKEYPNGAMMFPINASDMNMDTIYAIHIFRQGGTEGEAKVTLKSIDLSAEYNNDYQLFTSNDNFSKGVEGKANPYYAVEDTSYIPVVTKTENEYIDAKQQKDTDTLRNIISQNNDDALEKMPISSSTELTFSDGQTDKVIYVKTYQSSKVTDDKQFMLTLSNPQNCRISSDVVATFTIKETREKPDAYVQVTDTSIGLNSEMAYVKVQRVGNVGGICNLYFNTVSGSFKAMDDYEPVAMDLTFMPGITEIKVPVPIYSVANDGDYFSAEITSVSNAVVVQDKANIVFSKDDVDTIEHENNYDVSTMNDLNSNFTNMITNPLAQASKTTEDKSNISLTGADENGDDYDTNSPVTYKSTKYRGVEYFDFSQFHMDEKYVRCKGYIVSGGQNKQHINFRTNHGASWYLHVTGIESNSEIDFTGVDYLHVFADHTQSPWSRDAASVAIGDSSPIVNDDSHATWMYKLKDEGRGTYWDMVKGIEREDVKIGNNWTNGNHKVYFTINRTAFWGDCGLDVICDGDNNNNLANNTYLQLKKYKLRILKADKIEVYKDGGKQGLEVVSKCGVIDPGTKMGDKRTGASECDIYRDEEAAFEIIYQKPYDKFTKFKGVYIYDSSDNSKHSDLITLSSTSFALNSSIIQKYGSYFKNDQIVIKPVFELCNSSVSIENHDMGEFKFTADNGNCTGTITRGDEVVGTISWTKSDRQNNSYIVGDTLKFESNIKYDSLKVTYTKRSAETKGGLATSPKITTDETSILVDDKYFSITPNVEVKDCSPKLNIKNPDCGTYSGKDEKYETKNEDGTRTVRGYTSKDAADTVFKSLAIGNILSVSATPNPGYRAKWSYRDSTTHNTRIYYGNSFFFIVQNCFQSLDNDVALEFEKCDSITDVVVTGKTLVQKGDILHQPDSTTIYEPCPSATILMDSFTSSSTAKGNFTLYKHDGTSNNEAAKLKVGAHEVHRALVTYNNQAYVVDVNLANSQRMKNGSYDAEIKIDFKSNGVRPLSIAATDNLGRKYGDTITLIKATPVQFDMKFARDNEEKSRPVNLCKWTVVNKKGTITHTFDEQINKDSNNAHFANVLSEVIHPGDSLYVELLNKKYNIRGDAIYKSYGRYNTGYNFISTAIEESITYMPDMGAYSQASRDVKLPNGVNTPNKMEKLAEPCPVLGPFSPMFSLFGFKPIYSVDPVGKDEQGNQIHTIRIGISFSLLKDLASQDPKWGYSSYTDRFDIMEKLVKNLDESYNEFMKGRKAFPKACGGRAYGLQNSTCVSFSVSFCFQSYYYTDKSTGEYRVLGSMIIAGGGGSISWSFPFVLFYVPTFVFLGFEAKLNFFINISPKKTDESGKPTYLTLPELADRTLSGTKCSTQITPSFEVGAGIGFDCIACVKGSIEPEFNIRMNDFDDLLVKFALTGKIGIQFLFLSWSWDKKIVDKVLFDSTNEGPHSLLAEGMDDTSVSSIKIGDMDKEYYPILNENYDSNSNEKTLLYTNALDKTQMCKIGDNKYFVAEYCKDDKDKDQTLHYAIYDNSTKEITKPQKVLDKLLNDCQNNEFENKAYVNDTKTLIDTDISITKAGNQLILAWNKVTENTDYNIDEIESLDTVTIMYDIEKDQFHDFGVIPMADKNGEEVVVAKPKVVYNEKLNFAQIFYQVQDMRNISNDSTFNQLLNKQISLYTSQIDFNKENPQWSEATPVFVEENRVNYYDAISKDDQILLTYVSTNKPGFTLEDAPGVTLDSNVYGSYNTTNNMYLQSYSYKDNKMVKGDPIQITDEDYVVANPQLVRIKNDDIDNILVFFKSNGRYAYQNIDTILTNGTYVDRSGRTKVTKDMMHPLFISDTDDHTVNDDFIMRTDKNGNLYGLYTQTEGRQRQIWATCFDIKDVETVDKTFKLDENGEVVYDDKGEPVIVPLEHPIKLINGMWGGKNYLTNGGVAGTDSGKFKDSFDADILDNGRILLLYNAFDYTYVENESKEEICTESNVRLVSGEYDTVENFEMPTKYDEIQFSNEYPTNGELIEVNMHAINTGVNSGKDVKYNLYVNDKLYDTQTVDFFEAATVETVTSYYQIPYDIDPSNVKMYFTVTEDNVEKLRSKTYSFTKGPKVEIDEATITPLDYFTDDNDDVKFLLTAEIYNEGNDYYKGGDVLKFVNTDLAALSLAVNGETEENLTVLEDFGNIKVPELEVGEKETITFISDAVPKSVFEKAAGQDAAHFQFLLEGKDDKEWDKLGVKDPFTMISLLDAGATQAPKPYQVDHIEADDISVYVNTSSKIDASLSPYEADLYSDITYKSSDEKVATVDEFGVVTGKSVGETTITLTAEDGTTEEITVTVETPYGDADRDTNVTILDATRIQQRLAKLIDKKDIDIEKANVNADFDKYGNDNLTIISSTLIQERLANIIDIFPIEEY